MRWGARHFDESVRTGAAFWSLRSGLVAAYPPLTEDERCDVAVIGAGVTGALTAQTLCAAGHDVVVLDQHDVALGSTAACTGLLQYETDTDLGELVEKTGIARAVASWKAGRHAIDAIARLCRDRLPPCGFARRPSLYLATTRTEESQLREELTLRARYGFEVDWLDAGALQGRHVKARGGIRSNGDAEIDPYRFTHALLDDVAWLGGRIYDRTEVTRIRASSRGVRLSTTRGPEVRARRVVVATGYDSDREIAPRKGQLHSTWAVVSEPVADLAWWTERALMWEARRPYTYLRTTDDGRIMVGGEDEPWARQHRSERTLSRKTRDLTRRFAERMPGVDLDIAYAWAGTFATSRDGLPFIGPRADRPHTWFALGYGGNGITFSMIAAERARQWLAGAPLDDLFAFDRASAH
jgi:glycine/D-amino acid oxidase-like deaminating enzyme